jgi:23S rRNA pseudouridine955/2504/2580 synthase
LLAFLGGKDYNRIMVQLISDKTQSLKEFTENNCAQAAFFWHQLLKAKDIKVNGKRVNGDTTIYKGDVVAYYLTPKQAQKPAFFNVYEDEHILIVDKESGVNSEAVFAALVREGEYYFIHRLDRNTKGLLVFAKNEKAEKALLWAFKDRSAEKRYHALCFGTFEKETAILTAYLKKDAGKALVKVYDKPVTGAEKIVTEYKVLQRFENGTSKVEVTLHTGKTHQIRAHLAYVGCPIVGDMKYGDTTRNKEKNATRQMLVAKYLRFTFDGEFSYLNDREWVSQFNISGV